MSRGLPLTFAEKVLNYGYEAAWLPAAHASPVVARELVKSAQMREISNLGTRLAVVVELLVAFFRSFFGKRAPDSAGPRREMCAGALFTDERVHWPHDEKPFDHRRLSR